MLAVAEVIVLHKGGGAHSHAHAVLGVAIIVVVVNMHCAGADTGMAGVGVVEPVVVVGGVILRGFVLHTLEVALAAVPEVVVGMGDVGLLLGNSPPRQSN